MSMNDRAAIERLKEDFVRLLPDIERYGCHVFRGCRHADREELVAETVARAWLFFVRLSARGMDPRRLFRSVLRFSVLAIKENRRVGGRRNSRDLCHQARRDGIRLWSMEERQPRSGLPWREILTETRTFSPADTAATRLDMEAWFRLQSDRHRSIAKLLAVGERTSTVAAKFELSSARISQLRRELKESWDRFQGMDLGVPKCLAATA